MQVYTKILIGMLVGALLGLGLGPNSALLDADAYDVSQWDRLDLRSGAAEDAPRVQLPRGDGRTPIRLRRAGAAVSEPGASIEVRLRYTRSLALRDPDHTLARQLGDPRLGDEVAVWLVPERVGLDGGGEMFWPPATSGFGQSFVSAVRPLGQAFMRLIKMVIVPLVFSSLLVGVASLGDVRKLGRLGVRTLGLYLGTTAVAVTIGLVCAQLLAPGHYVDEASRLSLQSQFRAAAGGRVEQAAGAPSAIDNLLDVIPVNPIESLVTGNMLQVIFFAVLFGIALTLLEGDRGKVVVTFLDRVQDAMIVIIHIVMKLAPYGVAALVAEVVGTSGFSVLRGLLVYGVTVLIGLGLHGFIVYGVLVRWVARLRLRDFLVAARPARLIAFSTSSSSAALPVTLECAEDNLGISNPVASFVIPLGSTVNMDGTALYQGVAAVFIAQVFQMDLTLLDQLGIVLTATMASIGAAGVPGAGMVTLAMVLTSAGIPAVGVALILGLDRLLDMFRTALNVTGDLAVAASVARIEGETPRVLSPQEDRADPARGFESRLHDDPRPIDPEE